MVWGAGRKTFNPTESPVRSPSKTADGVVDDFSDSPPVQWTRVEGELPDSNEARVPISRSASVKQSPVPRKVLFDSEPDQSALVVLEISSPVFAKDFNYFLVLSSSGGSDNTEVALNSMQPEFRRNRLAVPRGSGKISLEAFAYLGKDSRKLLGSMSLPAELPDDAPDLVISGAQFLREGKVYGKCNLRIILRPGNFKSSPAPRIELVTEASNSSSAKPGNVKSVEPGNLNSEIQAMLLREHADRSAALKAANEELETLRKTNASLMEAISRLHEEVEGEERLAETADGYLTVDALEGLSPEELAQRLRVALNRYRSERQKAEAARQKIKASEHITSKLATLEEEHVRLKMLYEDRVKQVQMAKAEDEKIDTYKQTIISQEAVIQKLERVVKKSLKDVKSAQDNQLALEKLRLENIQLRQAANTFSQEPPRKDEELRFEIQRAKERIASLERQLIEAAKTHGQQLATLQLAKEN